MLRHQKMYFSLLAALAAMVLFTGATQALTYETVLVGNAGNAADTFVDPDDELVASFGYGAVAYEYNIGKFEVTAGQYTELLNAVAAADPYGLYNPAMQTPMYDIETHISVRLGWQLYVQRAGTMGEPSGEFRFVGRRGTVCQLDAQRAADRRAGHHHDRGRIVLSQRGSGWYRSSVNST